MELYTAGGHVLAEVVSALQKDVRRGNEVAAMYWALEMVPRFEAYLWRRLCVIVNEDVGLAAPQLLMLVPIQRALYLELREEGRDGSARLVLANVILALCRSPKTRLADHFQCVVNQGRLRDKLRLAIPDYALDKHTRAGRKMGRDTAHFLDEGCVLSLGGEVPDTYADKARELWSEGFLETNWGKRVVARGKGGRAIAVTEADLDSLMAQDSLPLEEDGE